MTAFWAVLTGAACGVFVYALAAEDPGKAAALGAFSCVAGAVMVWLWREFKNPG